MVAVCGNTLKDGRLRKYNGNSTEFKFVFKSYSGVVARTTDLVALMSSMSKMRTGTSDRSAAESWLIPKKWAGTRARTRSKRKRATRTRRVG